MPIYEIEVRGARYEIEAPDDAAAANAARGLQQQPQHFDFDPANVPAGQPGPRDADMTAGLSSFIEGIPVAGPYLQAGVENVAAGIGSLLSGRPQADVRAEMGELVDRSQRDNPITSTLAGGAGAVAGTLPLIMAAPGAFGAGSAGLAMRTAASTASGAALGGADAAVRSGGNAEAIKDGALWGGGLGLAGPAVGQAVGAGVRSIANRVGRSSPSAAARALSRAAGRDAITDPAARLGAMGGDAMPMDLGPNLQRQAGALAATPGRGQEIIRSAIAARQGGAGARVAGALDDALGQSVDTLAVADDIIARRGAAAKPLYDAAYSKPVPFTKELETLLKRPSVGRALAKAKGLAADEGIPSQQWFANIADDGTVTIKNVPDVRQLDLTKRALDDMISAAQRAGNNNEARILTQQKNLLVGMVDDAVPEYAQARQAFSGPTAVLDAMEAGRTAFKNSVTPAQLRKQLGEMGQAEREAFIQGARAQVADIMGTARNNALKARDAFQKGYNREKLELLVGRDQASRLINSLDTESAFTRTRDVVTGNSETAARAAAQADVGAGKQVRPGFIRNALNMDFGDAVASLGDRMAGGVRAASQDRMNTELAELLTSRDPRVVTQAIRLVQGAARRGEISAERAKEIVQSFALGGAQRRQPLEVTVTPAR